MHSKQTILHYSAEFIIDENEVTWFVGGSDIVTQKTPPPAPPQPREERQPGVNPTLQVRQKGRTHPYLPLLTLTHPHS